jgi:hypothetical protein
MKKKITKKITLKFKPLPFPRSANKQLPRLLTHNEPKNTLPIIYHPQTPYIVL